MSVASLLVYKNSPTFAFEHAMAHRNMLGGMAPLDQFSVLPYLLDPMQKPNEPVTKWHLNHQQAHNDAMVTLLSPYYGLVELTGINSHQILIDTPLAEEGPQRWWTFNNQQEHLLAQASILLATELTYPSW